MKSFLSKMGYNQIKNFFAQRAQNIGKTKTFAVKMVTMKLICLRDACATRMGTIKHVIKKGVR